MISTCPICQHERTDMLPRGMYISTAALHILRRINRTWAESDGICQRCYEAATDTACELEDMEAEQGGVSGFVQYFRYHLTRRESSQWHHKNPDFQKWHRANIDERATAAAKAAGRECWTIFDCDETLLAQGCLTEGGGSRNG